MKRKLLVFFSCFFYCSLLFSTQYSKFTQNGSYGVIDKNRKIIMEPKYKRISFYNNGNGIITSDSNGIKIYNSSLKQIYTADSNTYDFPTENIIRIETRVLNGVSEYLLLDLKTEKVIQTLDQKLLASQYGFRGGVGVAWLKIIDTKGNLILEDLLITGHTFSEGLLPVIMKDKSGFINKKGKFVIETKMNYEESLGPKGYTWIDYYFHEGYALVDIGDKSYLFNKKGQRKEVPDNIEVATLSYNSGLALIRDKATGKYGYMNTDFEIVIPGQFTEANDFIGPYAIVTYQEKDAIVDTKGNIYFCDEFCK